MEERCTFLGCSRQHGSRRPRPLDGIGSIDGESQLLFCAREVIQKTQASVHEISQRRGLYSNLDVDLNGISHAPRVHKRDTSQLLARVMFSERDTCQPLAQLELFLSLIHI